MKSWERGPEDKATIHRSICMCVGSDQDGHSPCSVHVLHAGTEKTLVGTLASILAQLLAVLVIILIGKYIWTCVVGSRYGGCTVHCCYGSHWTLCRHSHSLVTKQWAVISEHFDFSSLSNLSPPLSEGKRGLETKWLAWLEGEKE